MSQLAEIVGVTTSSVTKKKQQNIFPVEWAFLIGRKYDVLTEWILLGIEPKRLTAEKNENFKEEDSNNEEVEVVECYRNRKFIKRVPIIKGGLYEVDPLNPRKIKLKGERVIIIDTEFMGPIMCLRIDSEWHFKRRDYVEVDPCDLKLISAKPDWEEVVKIDSTIKNTIV